MGEHWFGMRLLENYTAATPRTTRSDRNKLPRTPDILRSSPYKTGSVSGKIWLAIIVFGHRLHGPQLSSVPHCKEPFLLCICKCFKGQFSNLNFMGKLGSVILVCYCPISLKTDIYSFFLQGFTFRHSQPTSWTFMTFNETIKTITHINLTNMIRYPKENDFDPDGFIIIILLYFIL